MKNPRLTYVGLGLFVIWLLTTTILRTNLNTKVRLFSDDYDRLIYFQRGLWFVNHQVPYQDTLSEYPQVPTYLFGLIHVASLGENNASIAHWKYSSLFSLLMLIVLLATVELLQRMLPKNSSFFYLLLLPAPLFFSINRFDILPAFLTLLSFKMIQDKRWNAATILLGIGTLTKWYPALLLPAYMLYQYRTTGRFPWQMGFLFFVTCFFIILPTLYSGGIEALAVPYRFHMERGIETVSLPTLLSKSLSGRLDNFIDQKGLALTFLLLQVAPIPFLIFIKIDNLDRLLNTCILIISNFVLFSRIYSPQWLLWILPFSVLAARNGNDVRLLSLYGIMTYVGFPLVWDYFGSDSREMIALSVVNILFLTLMTIQAIYRLHDSGSTFAYKPETR